MNTENTPDRQSRIAFLRSRIEATRRQERNPTFDVPFRGGKQTLAQLELRTDFPMYRIQSGRTHRAQTRYLDRHADLPLDFFDDPEDPNVQAAQHDILVELVNEGGLDTDLASRGQWNPLIVTYDGFVVDGNRRLCALREDGVEYVRAVVLPEDAESSEIYETEVELQMAAETKAPYNWIDEALHIRYGIEQLHERPEIVAQRMRMDEDAIREAVSQLSIVDMYLDWLGETGKYHIVPVERGGSAQQAFRDLTEALNRQSTKRLGRDEQKALRESCFALILAGGGYKDVRRAIGQLRTRPDQLVSRVRQQLSPELLTATEADTEAATEREAPQEAGAEEDLLSQLANAEPIESSDATGAVLAMVKDAEIATQIAPTLITVLEDLEAEDKDSRRQMQPLQRAQKVLKDLEAIELPTGTSSLEELAETISKIVEAADNLAQQISSLRSTSEE